MSEISKERAQEIFLGNGPEPTVAEERELARIALDWLALREWAEPVAWVPQYQLDLLKKSVIVEADLSSMQRFDEVPLYAAPPAPVAAGWIACSDRMPEREYVLAADFSGAYYLPSLPNTQVGIYADWFEDGKPSWDDGDGNDLHLKQVTHWMPLPEAPGKN
ncbi:DUF551 domain-containing protein [Cronobacter malonaticus]